MVKKKRKQANKQTKTREGKIEKLKSQKFFWVGPQDTIFSFVQEPEILQPANSYSLSRSHFIMFKMEKRKKKKDALGLVLLWL